MCTDASGVPNPSWSPLHIIGEFRKIGIGTLGLAVTLEVGKKVVLDELKKNNMLCYSNLIGIIFKKLSKSVNHLRQQDYLNFAEA